MENKPKTIEEATILELKADAFDAIGRIEYTQNYLTAINKELERRTKDGVTAQAVEDVPVAEEAKK